MKKNYNVLDLFCGCGGLSLGIKSASDRFKVVGAIDFNKNAIAAFNYNFPEVGEGCVCADITELSPEEYQTNYLETKKIDVITGGPPCPGFSNIGRSKIMNLIKTKIWDLSESRHQFVDDPRNKLFYEFVKYVKHFKPKIFLFENVKGISSYKAIGKKGEVNDILDVIMYEFEKLDYIVMKDLLNASDFGVPQNRERYFIVGVRKDLSIGKDYFSFPEETHCKSYIEVKNEEWIEYEWTDDFDEVDPEYISDNSTRLNELFHVASQQAIMDLPVVEYPSDMIHDDLPKIEKVIEDYKRKYTKFSFVNNELSLKSMSEFLRGVRGKNNLLKPGMGIINTINCHYPREVNDLGDEEIFPKLRTEPDEKQYKYSDLPDRLKRYGLKNGEVENKSTGFHDKMRRIPWWKPSWTIVAHLAVDGYMFVHPDTDQNRTITAREAARLQSFPDTFDFSADGTIARGHQFRMIGNAVPPLLAKALGIKILDWLDKH